MQCEVCGRTVYGPPKRVVIDTTAFLVCSSCARYGTPIHASEKGTLSISTKHLKRPLPKTALEKTEQQLGVVSNFGDVIKRAREGFGLTQEVLAKLVGEKLSVIKRIEAGRLKPSIGLARKIEKVLKIKLIEETVTSEAGQLPKSKLSLTIGDVAVIKERGGARGPGE